MAAVEVGPTVSTQYSNANKKYRCDTCHKLIPERCPMVRKFDARGRYTIEHRDCEANAGQPVIEDWQFNLKWKDRQ